jgi:hypothetical protein
MPSPHPWAGWARLSVLRIETRETSGDPVPTQIQGQTPGVIQVGREALRAAPQQTLFMKNSLWSERPPSEKQVPNEDRVAVIDAAQGRALSCVLSRVCAPCLVLKHGDSQMVHSDWQHPSSHSGYWHLFWQHSLPWHQPQQWPPVMRKHALQQKPEQQQRQHGLRNPHQRSRPCSVM